MPSPDHRGAAQANLLIYKPSEYFRNATPFFSQVIWLYLL
jgi:hypothetical protein